MPETGLRGPYALDSDTIDRIVTRTSAGAYALGRVSDKTFYISYIGRSDNDVHGRLKKWAEKYSSFKFEYYGSPKAAFEKECNLYHDWGESEKLDNDIHPQRPEGSDWKCPRCNVFG